MKYTPVWAWFTTPRRSCRTLRRSSTISARTSATSAPGRITGSAKKPSRYSVRCCGDIPRRIARGSCGSFAVNSATRRVGIIFPLGAIKHFSGPQFIQYLRHQLCPGHPAWCQVLRRGALLGQIDWNPPLPCVQMPTPIVWHHSPHQQNPYILLQYWPYRSPPPSLYHQQDELSRKSPWNSLCFSSEVVPRYKGICRIAVLVLKLE